MLIGMVAGLTAGLLAHFLAPGAAWVDWVATNVATPIGQIFLRLLFMLVVPLILSALVVGMAGIDLRAARSTGPAHAGLRRWGLVHRRRASAWCW